MDQHIDISNYQSENLSKFITELISQIKIGNGQKTQKISSELIFETN
jgi:hypothetical protein